MKNAKYLNIAISELEAVISELKLRQNNMTDETKIQDCFDKANFIIDNFFQGNQIVSSDALEAGFDTSVREDLFNEMLKFE
jgi:hypothetical protein